MARGTKAPDEFAAAMQQLSAEAEQSVAPNETEQPSRPSDAGELVQELRALNAHVQRVETALSKQIEQLGAMIPLGEPVDLAEQFQKIDEQLAAIRTSEGVNQRLYDSLHEELLKYRDNFLHESLQKPFIHDLILLFDDLSGLSEQLRTAVKGQRDTVAQWRDNLENAIHSLVEIFHRLDVKEIEPLERVDRAIHRVVSYEPADFAEEDGRIVMRVKRGFCWRGKVIRAEEVIAKRFN
ncbi:MAG: nucleotide exchange factor GrpE [Chthoniobacterales bacterium]